MFRVSIFPTCDRQSCNSQTYVSQTSSCYSQSDVDITTELGTDRISAKVAVSNSLKDSFWRQTLHLSNEQRGQRVRRPSSVECEQFDEPYVDCVCLVWHTLLGSVVFSNENSHFCFKLAWPIVRRDGRYVKGLGVALSRFFRSLNVTLWARPVLARPDLLRR